jgi:hypothetical protein
MRVILFTFAGRKDRMFMLEKSVQKALDSLSIDEWHVWDFAKKQEDENWIHKNYSKRDKIKIKSRTIENESKYWSASYEYYYKQQYENYSDCIFIKVDDDVAGFDVKELGGFIEEIQKLDNKNYISANVINNSSCYFFQKKYSYFDETFDFSPHDLWAQYSNAKRVHNFFVHNYEKIKNIAHTNSRIEKLPLDIPTSINFIGFKFEFLRYFVDILNDGKSIDDEYIISKIHREKNKANCFIYERLLVPHITFNAQEKTKGQRDSMHLVNLYKDFTF